MVDINDLASLVKGVENDNLQREDIYGQNGLPVCVAKDDDFKIANQTDGANDKGPNAPCNQDVLYTGIINPRDSDNTSFQTKAEEKEVAPQTKATKEDTLPMGNWNRLSGRN